MKRLWIIACLLCSCLPLMAQESLYLQPNVEFTRWMKVNNSPDCEYRAYVREIEKKGLFVMAIEGRWQGDHAEFRVRVVPRRTDIEMHRYWWFGMTEDFYKEQLLKLTQQNTFRCVWTQHFTDGDGIERYQMIFLKFLPLNSEETGTVPSRN
jgi:hypothetical protein